MEVNCALYLDIMQVYGDQVFPGWICQSEVLGWFMCSKTFTFLLFRTWELLFHHDFIYLFETLYVLYTHRQA